VRQYIEIQPQRLPEISSNRARITPEIAEGAVSMAEEVFTKPVEEWLDELTADCPKKQARNMNDPCGAKCPELARVL